MQIFNSQKHYLFSQAGQDKKNQELLVWTKDVVNHYWYTAKTCNSIDTFKVSLNEHDIHNLI